MYITSKDLPGMVSLQEDPEVPRITHPKFLAVADGTEIYWYPEDGQAPWKDEQWRQKLRDQWEEEVVNASVQKIWSEAEATSVDAKPENRPTEFRKVFSIRDNADTDENVKALEKSLGEDYTVDMTCGILTIIPSKAGKGPAADDIREKEGFSNGAYLWAGATRADLSLLKTSMPGVIVGNAEDEVKQKAAPLVHQQYL